MTAHPNWALLQAVIAGGIALPDSPDYEQRFRAFNARYHHLQPRAIVSCAIPDDVSATISYVARHGLDFVVRGGGHCFGGRSSTNGVLLDVTTMRAVSVSSGTVRVAGGARLGHVYQALDEYDLTIPGGTCPEVGIGGLALGGGLGILGRTYGVTSDRLLGAQIVLADGRIIDCDEHHEAELFWALRGGGANFGVVTSLSLAAVPARSATNFHLCWPYRAATAVIDAWQRWAPHGPDELAASLKVTVSGAIDQPPSVDVYGVLFGTQADAAELLDGLCARVGSDPTALSSRHLSPADTRRFWAELGTSDDAAVNRPGPAPLPSPHLRAKSEFFRRRLPIEAIDALLDRFKSARVEAESRELDFMPWGGAYNRVRSDASAFVHRDEQFLLKHAVTTDPHASPRVMRSAQRWLDASWATTHPWGSRRVFPNFDDPDLDGALVAYYGANLQRLVQVKSRYDPSNTFRFDQSLPVA